VSTVNTKRVYADWRWQAIRKAAIRKARGECELKLPGCTQFATQGDHITALEDGGPPFSPYNVQASCQHCNVAKENNRRLGREVRTSRQW
jgi:5-methylcytosine-specific restriction endonuclease McrA